VEWGWWVGLVCCFMDVFGEIVLLIFFIWYVVVVLFYFFFGVGGLF